MTSAPKQSKIDRFARLIATGSTQSDAYRRVYPRSLDWQPESVWAAASRLANSDKVRSRVEQLRKAITRDHEEGVAEYERMLLAGIDQAMQAGNLNAMGGMLRQLGQLRGALGNESTTVNISTDAQLLSQIKQINPGLAAALEKEMPKDGFDKPKQVH